MAYPLVTSQVQIQRHALALYNIQLGGTVLNEFFQQVGSSVDALSNLFNLVYIGSIGNESTTEVATNLVKNVGIVAGSNGLTDTQVADAVKFVTDLLEPVTPEKRGAVIQQILNNFATLASDPKSVYKAAATAWNASVDNAIVYANNHTDNALADAPVSNLFTLTTGPNTFGGTAISDTFTALTINAEGYAASTLTAFDTIDGGAGTDTLNIYTEVSQPTVRLNAGMPTTATVKNVEIVNIYNTTEEAALFGDASKFAGVTQLWQHGTADAVTNLAVGTTAGFKNISTDVSAAAAKGVASIAVALDGLADSKIITPAQVVGTWVTVSGDALNAVTVTGTVKDGIDENTKVDSIKLEARVGKDVQTLTLNSAVDATVTVITNNTSTKDFTTLDASGSTGAIQFDGTSVYLNAQNQLDFNYKVATIKTGSGNDYVTLMAKTKAASGSTAAVSATVDTGAGNDSIFVDTKAVDNGNPLFLETTGTTTVEAGAGDDNVKITTRSEGKLTVNLGDGTDSFTSLVAIGGTDAIDAGAGVDTLFLSLVGAANVGAFSNFDVFDVKGMNANLDLKILNTKNTVAEIVGSGATDSDVELLNVGAGVNFRATADMTTASTTTVKTVTLTQKTAGALTVTLDADETGSADDAIDSATTAVKALNATSLKAVFDTNYLATISGEALNGDNVSTINLTTQAAASISVVSGGENTENRLKVTEGNGTDALTTVTVTGAQALDLVVEGASKLATIDASAATGGLVASLDYLKNTGTIKLGTGTDKITVTTNSTDESIQNFQKAADVSVSATASTAKTAAIDAADKIVIDSDMAVADSSTIDGGKISNGVLSFSGTGPATLDDAILIAKEGTTNNHAVVFEYVGDSYVFIEADSNGIVVELTGITGVTNFVEDADTNLFFIV